MPDGYMDAAAVPVPDTGDDTLREQLVEAALVVWQHRSDERITESPTEHCAAMVDALLPRTREHVAAAVQAERERAAEILNDCSERTAKLAEELDDYKGRYETSHDSRMHAEKRLDDMTREARLSRESTGKAVARAERAEAAIERVRQAVAVFCHGEQAYAEHGHYCVPILNALDGMEATP